MPRGEFTMIENPVPWPNGARCAVNFSWDVDVDSILHLAHPDDADTRLLTMSDLRYGTEVAIPRICRAFESRGLKCTFYVPGWSAEEHPRAIERMLEGGHEIGHHGYMHELPNRFTPERERYWTKRGFDALKKAIGKNPVGYRAPWGAYSKYTTEILADLGFLYDSSMAGDDVPYLVKGPSGRELIELPLKLALDDWPHFQDNGDLDYFRPISSPAKAREVFMSEFEAAWKYRTWWQAIWHCFVSGRVPRLDSVMSMVDDMEQKGDVWFATAEEIALHVRGLIDAGTYTPRVYTLPLREGRIPDIPLAPHW
jgi:peptidoglycan-N-acetylglucosamine deacetylase